MVAEKDKELLATVGHNNFEAVALGRSPEFFSIVTGTESNMFSVCPRSRELSYDKVLIGKHLGSRLYIKEVTIVFLSVLIILNDL